MRVWVRFPGPRFFFSIRLAWWLWILAAVLLLYLWLAAVILWLLVQAAYLVLRALVWIYKEWRRPDRVLARKNRREAKATERAQRRAELARKRLAEAERPKTARIRKPTVKLAAANQPAPSTPAAALQLELSLSESSSEIPKAGSARVQPVAADLVEGAAAEARGEITADPIDHDAHIQVCVVLDTVGPNKMAVVDLIQTYSPMPLSKAKVLVKTTPQTVLSSADMDRSDRLLRALDALGAAAHLQSSDGHRFG